MSKEKLLMVKAPVGLVYGRVVPPKCRTWPPLWRARCEGHVGRYSELNSSSALVFSGTGKANHRLLISQKGGHLMRTSALTLATCTLVLLSATFAQEAGKKGKEITVREIDLKGHLPAEAFMRGPDDPTSITGAKKLAEVFPHKESQKAITKQVDFTKEDLLLFAWLDGRREYKLSYKIENGKKGPIVVFRYSGSSFANDSLERYVHLFVLPKGTAWRFHGK
jgi:hypothetical protein